MSWLETSLSLWYLDRLSLSGLAGMLLNAAVFQMSQELQIRALERRLPRSQHHVHSGPEPLSELILHSQDLYFFTLALSFLMSATETGSSWAL